LPQVVAFPEVRRLFERVKRERRLVALATSSSADELDYYRSLMNVGDLVDAVSCGDDVHHDKPDSALIDVVLLRAGNVPPEDAVMIGDTPYDAMAAKRARVGAIGIGPLRSFVVARRSHPDSDSDLGLWRAPLNVQWRSLTRTCAERFGEPLRPPFAPMEALCRRSMVQPAPRHSVRSSRRRPRP
jgi:beta-phosphoglucomutase-like phosphatase (HAD superfamily)